MNHSPLFFIAGGSGGHIIPLLVRAAEYRKNAPHSKFFFCVENKKVDKQVSKKYEHIGQFFFTLPLQLHKTTLLTYPFFILKLLWISIKAFFLLAYYKPARIVTSGGINAVPFCFIATVLDIPIDLYELNSIPGKAAHLISYWAENIFITFAGCQKYFSRETHFIPYPLRFEQSEHFVTKDILLHEMNSLSLSSLPFSLHRKTLFILGGSQGSLFLNALWKDWLEKNYNADHIQVIHQIGFNETIDWKEFYSERRIPAIVFSYYEDIELFYRISDVIICRSGAGTLFEIEFFKKKCITIPLITDSTRHQVSNALEMMERHPSNYVVLFQNDPAFEESFEASLNSFLSKSPSFLQHS